MSILRLPLEMVEVHHSNWQVWLFPSKSGVFMCCPASTAGQMELRKAREPSNKRVKPLSRVTSLANLIPPVKATPLKRFSQTLQVRTQWVCVCRKPCCVGGVIAALPRTSPEI